MERAVTVHAFGRQFRHRPGYLNAASIGVPPQEAADAVAEAVRSWADGRSRPADFDSAVETARAGFAALTGMPVDDVAQGATVSGLVADLAAGVPDGTRVLVAEHEFASLTRPFARQARRGVRVTAVPLPELAAHAGGHDVVAVSVVQSADGRIADLDALHDARARHGVRLLYDLSQAAGWFPVRRTAVTGADAVVAAGYKWLMAPRGAAWLARRPTWTDGPPRGRAWPEPPGSAAGWYGAADRATGMYVPDPAPRPGPAGTEESPVWLAHVGAAVTLPWLAELDPQALYDEVVGHADALRDRLGLAPSGSAVVSVRDPGVADRLAGEGITASVRGGAARLAFHLAATGDDVDAAARALSGAALAG
ncbi:aminotransferase class V-fold PLP-dependent enzyme [Pseudonocardia phyllosphaerae]|uniref:aminotransferase class V-fold PLP-dependent enzyme n=1 Tax=Pseudonocardia phyllosphaerae TaxID=3390502 RepID=UPI00397D7D5B